MEATTQTTGVDLLPGYTDTKLKLASIAEILLTIASERKDNERTHTIQRLLADLAEDAFRLAVVGKYNRGKSSLMNAMLGHDWLPTGILPLTSVITTVRYGTKQRVLIRTEGSSLAHEISVKNLPQYVTEEYNPANEKRVELAEIQLPSDLLRYGFLFMDTPGLGSGITANTEATRRFLPEIDAAVVVLSFESALDQADMDLLASLHRLRRKLFIVLNKADLVSREEQERVASFVRQRLADQAGETPLLFPLSARDGLRARLNGDDALLESSGLKAFEDQLVHFLTTQKAELFLHRAIERARELIEQEQLESFLSEQLKSDTRKVDELRSIEAQKENVLTQVNAAFTRFHQQLSGVFYTLLDDDLSRWCQERKSEILRATETQQDFRAELRDEWIRPRVAAAANQLREAERNELAELASAFKDLLTRGNHLQGRESSDKLVDEFDVLQGITGRDIDIPKLPPLQCTPPDWMQAIPSMWLRRKATARVEKEASLAVDSYRERLKALFEQACHHWLDSAQREAERRIQAYIERFEALTQQSNRSESVSILRDLTQRLNEVVEGSNGAGADTMVSRSGSEVADSAEICSVCQKASDAAFRFLSRFQYQLIKDPMLQEEIGSNGGLCPFHTWIYESISSPQGVAQGYAPVLERFAVRLEELAQEAEIGRISEQMLHLLPTAKSCRICQVTSAAESLALDEISQVKLAAEMPQNLCLIHLAALIARVKDSDVARQWIMTEAVQLRRLAQDMRQFALKHSALRHYLSTEGEHNAYLYGLIRLVGARQLSFVRQVQELY